MIYLDNAATSFPKPPRVAEEVSRYLREYAVSSGRSGYRASMEVSGKLYECREKIGRLFNIDHTGRIVFTLNTTCAINFALKGILGEGDTVITSSMEHNAVMRPLNYLKEKRSIKVVRVPGDKDGFMDLKVLEKELSPSPKLCVINHASNVNGMAQDITEIARLCEENGVPLLSDAAQSAGCLGLDVKKSGIDMLAFSAHKGLMGPAGAGCLYVSKKVALPPLIQGGTGSASESEIQPDFYPDRFESGTLPLAAIIGLDAALDFILSRGLENIISKKKEITSYLLQGLEGIEGVKIYGPSENRDRVAVVSVMVKDKAPSEIARSLNESDICVRVGLHCAPSAHRTLGTFPQGTVRISPGYFTRRKDIDTLVETLKSL